MIDPDHPKLSIVRQCELLGISRSGYYYEPALESPLNLMLMRLIDEKYTRFAFYGSPRMTAWLRREGYGVG
jgi:putative transposase